MKYKRMICWLLLGCLLAGKATGQSWTGHTIEFVHPAWGGNGDFTAITRVDSQGDRTHLRVMMGDEVTSDFEIGYVNWQTGQWVNTFTLDGYGNSYIQGNVGIGTITPDAKLTVKGDIHSREVRVDLANSVAPDYVFEPNYALPSLTEIESYIKQNKHLPNVPSAQTMEEKGIHLKEMNLLLLKKIEELTLYIIEIKKSEDSLKERIKLIEEKLN